ncbi:DUF600 family protein [Terribacillus saccharophilus]|uniref:immunity protein YezG family protein n=1 Tax=Terribacillus saccharophilus TaxID=361277 RepID=UPI0039819F12
MDIFEEKFSELQADMISICLEYVDNRADKVYVYASCEGDMISSSFYYLINNIYVECHKVNSALEEREEKYDVSSERMFQVLQILNEDIEEIEILCKDHKKEMPTEMKLIYDVGSGNFKAEYSYELIHTNEDIKTADDFADEWFEQIKNNSL